MLNIQLEKGNENQGNIYSDIVNLNREKKKER